MNTTMARLVSEWDALPRYRKRSFIRSLAVAGVDVAILGYEARKIGFREAITPRWIWNMSRERQRLRHFKNTMFATSVVVQNHLNERDLAKRANAHP